MGGNEHPQTELIIVDTLQYIRNTGKFTGTYSGDYHDMDALREIIAGRNLTMKRSNPNALHLEN